MPLRISIAPYHCSAISRSTKKSIINFKQNNYIIYNLIKIVNEKRLIQFFKGILLQHNNRLPIILNLMTGFKSKLFPIFIMIILITKGDNSISNVHH